MDSSQDTAPSSTSGDERPGSGTGFPETQVIDLDFEVAKANLDLVIDWVRHADAKAAFYLTVALAMLGASLTEVSAFVRVCDYLFSNASWWLPTLLILAHTVFYGASLYSAYKSIEVVQPRLAPDSKTHSWFFFQSIAGFEDLKKWRAFTNGLEGGDRTRHLVDQIWNVSRVAVSKYKMASVAGHSLRVAILSGIVSVVTILALDALLIGQ